MFGHFEGLCLSGTRAIIRNREENEILKYFFTLLDDQNHHNYTDCVIYCRNTPNKVTLNFELELLELDSMDLSKLK